MTGLLIVFEGIDGSGKSTQCRMMDRALRSMGVDPLVTGEPTDGPWGQEIRRRARSSSFASAREELDLFVADRRDHVEKLIGPALAGGRVVLMDRYYFSSVAYQGTRGVPPEEILGMHRFAPEPDLLFLVDVPAEEAMARISSRRGGRESFEVLEILRAVREAFLGMAFPRKITLDGRMLPGQVHESAMMVAIPMVEKWLARR